MQFQNGIITEAGRVVLSAASINDRVVFTRFVFTGSTTPLTAATTNLPEPVWGDGSVDSYAPTERGGFVVYASASNQYSYGYARGWGIYGYRESNPDNEVLIFVANSDGVPTYINAVSGASTRIQLALTIGYSIDNSVIAIDPNYNGLVSHKEFEDLLDRTVTTHSATSTNVGDNQTILGNKYFVSSVRTPSLEGVVIRGDNDAISGQYFVGPTRISGSVIYSEYAMRGIYEGGSKTPSYQLIVDGENNRSTARVNADIFDCYNCLLRADEISVNKITSNGVLEMAGIVTDTLEVKSTLNATDLTVDRINPSYAVSMIGDATHAWGDIYAKVYHVQSVGVTTNSYIKSDGTGLVLAHDDAGTKSELHMLPYSQASSTAENEVFLPPTSPTLVATDSFAFLLTKSGINNVPVLIHRLGISVSTLFARAVSAVTGAFDTVLSGRYNIKALSTGLGSPRIEEFPSVGCIAKAIISVDEYYDQDRNRIVYCVGNGLKVVHVTAASGKRIVSVGTDVATSIPKGRIIRVTRMHKVKGGAFSAPIVEYTISAYTPTNSEVNIRDTGLHGSQVISSGTTLSVVLESGTTTSDECWVQIEIL